MINIDWIYDTYVYDWERGQDDADGHRFDTFICYGNRLLAKVYDLTSNDTEWRILYINKNDHFKKYTVYGYWNNNSLVWFILWVLYNGERESD